jgi:thioredoxin-like negative regulator of GroEL
MSSSTPDALLFITPGCPHCPAVLQGLSDLVKQAAIGKLTVVNVAAHPQLAAEFGVRAAPWLRLGPFTLTGAHSATELRQWVEWSSAEAGIAHYIEHLLKEGGFKQAGIFIAEDTQRLKPLLAIVADPEKSIEVRVGVDALLEAYSNTPALQSLLPQLAALTHHSDHRVRADACHLLGLSGAPAARPYLASCVNDHNEEVREIAAESVELLDAGHQKSGLKGT